MKRNRFVNRILKAASICILTMATFAAAVPCIIYYYQPKMPINIKSRLDDLNASR